MKYKLLRYSLLGLLVIFFGSAAIGAIAAAGEQVNEIPTTAANPFNITYYTATTTSGTIKYVDGVGNTLDYFLSGDVVKYTVKNTKEAAYDISFQYATVMEGLNINFKLTNEAGENIYNEDIDVPCTSGGANDWSHWVNLTAPQTPVLPVGTYTFIITYGAGTFGGQSMSFTANLANFAFTEVGGQEEPIVVDWRDIVVDLMNGNLTTADEQVQWQQLPEIGIAVAEDGTVSRVEPSAENCAAVLTGKWHSAEHGWANFKAVVPVPGPVKITLGSCNWGGDVKVTNSKGEAIGTFTTAIGACYHNEKEANIVSFNYTGPAAILTIEGGNYVPYFAVQQLPKAEGTPIRVELLNSNLLSGDQINNRNLRLGLLIAEDGTPSFTDADDPSAVAILEGGDRQDDHGWINFKATVPVLGPVKITFGTCAWGGNVTVKNSEGEEVVPTFTTNTGACYHQNKAENVVSAYYKGGATTLTIQGGSYVPYFAVEPVAEWEIPNDVKVTFAMGNAEAEGVLPADLTVEFGSKFTLPQNRTLYAEGKTLTAWTDGSNLYLPEEEYKATENLDLTPVFTTNTVAFEDRTAEVTAVWDFQQKNGAPVLSHQGDQGIYVTQVTVKGKTIDLKMDFDTSGGKIANGNWQDWCQMNGGTKLTIPAFNGMTVSAESYSATTTTTFAGSTDYTAEGNVVTYTYAGDAETMDIVIGDGSYFRYFKAVYPAAKEAEPTGWQDIYVSLVGPLLKTNERTEGVNLEFGVVIAEDGTQTRVEANDPSANVILKGVFHDDSHGWTQAKAIVKVDGPVVIGVGNCQYGQQNASFSDADGNIVNFETAKNCWNASNPTENVTYIKYNGGPTTLTINGASYTPYFSIVAVKMDWDNEEAIATFPFNLGTEDQKADFGDNAEAFISSKVIVGSTLSIDGVTKNDETGIRSSIVNESTANDDNLLQFIIRPYPGIVFTPTKVSVQSTRYGTDSGRLDIAWLNPDGSKISLATNQNPNRDNNAEGASKYSYVITDANPGEGECGLLVNVYNVFENKTIGIGHIVIEGIVNGHKQEIPVLATMTANGITYDVEKTFEIQGDDYVANIELFKDETMISAENPVTVEVKEGQLGTITYEGDDSQCTVTIPVTHNDITMNWVANFVRKPFYTLTFFDSDNKTVLGTQVVEKDSKVEAYDFGADDVTVSEGYKFRGWTTQLAGANTVKSPAGSSFAQDTNLYPFITVIEVASTTARYDYDLTVESFDPDDHEMIAVEGGRYYNTHGWVFNGGDKVKLTMGGKGYIKLGLCLYSNTNDIVVTAPDGSELASFSARGNADGASTTVEYEGEAGELTIAFPAGGATYMHGFSIRNMAENPYELADGGIYIVKRGTTDTESGSNLLSMLELVNGIQGTDRVTVFLPDGTYDLGETVLTAISRSNVSLIGQSMMGTIIKNAPDRSIEGIGTTATLVNTSTGLYLQDLTLQNALDYYGAVAGGQVGGRAVCLWDKGKQTISKNVRMLSYQDTYYSNSNSQFYWETSEIHGTVDYLCGGGDVFYEKVKFVNETRKLGEKNGSDVIAAPYTDSSSQFGYVFNNCTVDNKAASFSFGRSWGGLSKLTYLNTTLLQPNEIIASRFTLNGMNVAAYSFKEYNSMDAQGNVVSPASSVQTFTHANGNYTYETILSIEEAAEYTIDKVFPNWTPQYDATQVDAPADAKYAAGSVTWTPADNGATAYALFKNGEFVGITTGYSFVITIDESQDELTIRAANKMGGFGPAAHVDGTTVGINATLSNAGTDVIYNMQGVRVSKTGRGLYIVNGKKVIK